GSKFAVDADVWARSRKEIFRNTADDSAFVKNNSDLPFSYKIYNRLQDFAGLEFMYFNSKTGDVIGPVYTEAYAMLLKVYRYDSTYRSHVSQIFFKVKGKTKKDTLAVIKKAEKYLAEIKAGKDFLQLVKQVSEDTITANNQGDLGWIWWGTSLPDINKFIKTAKVGDMTVIQSPEGVHLLRLSEEKMKDRFRVVMIPLVKKL
ncbi:MAG: peptidyl-prolyl cis-trans isomerase, partial [Verrucomicrobia bacterium]|nr:peptidyl-prolyl cis-trans isomerase [Cytophagales bacterium]